MVSNSNPLSPSSVNGKKENGNFKGNVLRNTNGYRPRSRNNNSPSPVLVTRETTQSRTQSPAPQTPPSSHRFSEEASIEIPHRTPSPTQQHLVHLPRYLKRPSFREISAAAIESIDPDLKGVALEFIYTRLQAVGEQMFTVVSTTTAHPPRDRLPRELQVVINDLSADPPTHLFAICSKLSSHISIHPIHALILAIHCANLPPLSPAFTKAYPPPSTPAHTGATLTLPVVPLFIPHPPTFSILLNYLYTKRRDRLLASLLPLPPRNSGATHDFSVGQLSEALATTMTLPVLLSHAEKVHGLWANVAGLGVFDKKLWSRMETVWEILATAIAKKTGSSWQTMTSAE